MNKLELIKLILANENVEQKQNISWGFDQNQYVIVRTFSAGVFAGYIVERPDKDCVIMKKARRLWYWDGASSLSQLAMEGVKHPENCKFPCEVEKIELMNVIEILHATSIAKESISGVPIWKQ